MKEHSYYTADAFSSRPFQGAQIAVFPDARDLETLQMQLVARELNLSETVFVMPDPERAAAFRLRVFSPQRELDFAAHPIVAAGAVLAQAARLDLSQVDSRVGTALLFELAGGPIHVHLRRAPDGEIEVQFELSVKPTVDRFVPRSEEIAAFLNLEPREVDAKPYLPMMVACDRPYLVVPVRSAEAVRRARFEATVWDRSFAPTMLAQELLLFARGASDPTADFHARLLGPSIGPREDPPIGAAVPAFASYLCAHDHVPDGRNTFSIERGTLATRLSLLQVEMDKRPSPELPIRIGGRAVVMSEGRMRIPAVDELSLAGGSAAK